MTTDLLPRPFDHPEHALLNDAAWTKTKEVGGRELKVAKTTLTSGSLEQEAANPACSLPFLPDTKVRPTHSGMKARPL